MPQCTHVRSAVSVRNHVSSAARNARSRWNRSVPVLMRRCLPLYEFGQMTGGKLLALLATSREVIRVTELRFSFPYVFFIIRTLHGKGIDVSLPRMFELLAGIRETVVIYPKKQGQRHPTLASAVSTLSPEQQQLFTALNLGRYL